MKKLILILLIGVMIIPIGFSQSLSLSDANGPIANNATITVQGYVDSLLQAHAYVTNNSASTITVRVKKEYISIITGSTNYFCWGNCYSSDLFVSGIAIPIGAGVTDYINFEGDYLPNGNPGVSTVRYTFYDDNNPNDSVAFFVDYSAIINGLDELLADIDFSEAYPNPASSQISFNYSFPTGVKDARIIVSNILGNTVKENLINDQDGKLIINTEDLTSGLYFYTLIVNDQIALSKKLIINR